MDNTTNISSLLSNNMQLCRICITSSSCSSSSSSSPNSNGSSNSTQMISIFGEDSLWKKITTLADVKIEHGDTLPQQVCITCAKNTISACLFKKKCEDADNFFRQQLLIRKIESKSDQKDLHETEDEEDTAPHNNVNGKNHKIPTQKSDEEPDLEEQIYRQQLQRQLNGHRQQENTNHDHGDDDNDSDHGDDGQVVEDDGEIKSANGQKPAFDFNSIRLMHEYMQQHLSKLNGLQGQPGGGGVVGGSDDEAGEGSGSDTEQDDDDEDGPLPLIPEIELITPSEDGGAGANVTVNGVGTVGEGGSSSMTAQMRGYQCPHCFQIFEMKQVLKAHMQSVHGTSGPVYECTNCKKTYFYKRFLEKHIRRGRCVKKRRNQTRPMQCSDCNVLFPTGHHLGWHKRTGCPSKTAKMPLQQLFKQNIVQYNNFPRRIGIRKPENAIYLHNRKIIMANNKRKGRTRIKLDARKIALAKQLILREATTTVIANELNISRTFAWRLRKSLVNGVSLHERVIDPPEDEEEDNDNNEATIPGEIESGVDGVALDALNNEKLENQFNHQPFTEHVIKRERVTTEDEEEEDNQQESEDEYRQQQQQQQQLLRQVNNNNNNNNNSVATSVIQRTNELKLNNAQAQQTNTTISNNNNNAILEQQQQHYEKLQNKISVVQQQRLMEINNKTINNNNNDNNNAHHDLNNDSATDSDSDNDAEDDEHLQQQYQRLQQQQQQLQQQNHELEETDHNNSQQTLFLQKSSNNLNDNENSSAIQLTSAVAAAINQLPVNLSIRPIASMQNNDLSSNNSLNCIGSSKKKPRKPNVFIDDEKYAMAKMLVAQNASTMEIAKALNVSQMTAWKLRDAIIKGVPLSYRNRRDIRMTMMRHDEDTGSVLSEGSDSRRETETERQQQALLVQQQLDHQQKLQQQHLQQQQQIQQLLQRQQQLQQQQQQLEQQKQQRLLEKEREQQQQLLLQQQQQKQLLQKQQQQQQSTTQIQQTPTEQQQQHNKHTNPRRRLKAAEREVRDKEITREILELIKEDNNIQYWKVSARLAEKGYAISPSSVCQKLKSMGIHRRWKPGDKPPLIDMEQLKGNHIQANNSGMLALATAAANAQNAASSSADESYEQQFDMGGAHFLSAFTR